MTGGPRSSGSIAPWVIDVIAAATYPENLRQSAVEFGKTGGPELVEEWVIGEFPISPPEALSPLFIAYSNGFSSSVRFVSRTETTFSFLQTSGSLSLTGRPISVELADLDGDGKPEAILQLTTGNAQISTWVFRVNSRQGIVSLGPPLASTNGIDTDLGQVSFVSLGEPGQMSLVALRENDEADLFDLDATGAYRLTKHVRYFREFARDHDRVSAYSAELGNLGVTRLKIVNGGTSPDSRVRSARVDLNGDVVFAPNSFGEDVGSLEAQIDLSGLANVFQVELRGSTGRKLTLLVE